MYQIGLNEGRKILETVDQGLVSGMGEPVPGRMCVEAAVCYALGLPHSDNPGCVSPTLRKIKILLNDHSAWKSPKSRAKGLRKLAILQLGTDKNFEEYKFQNRLFSMMVEKLKAKASLHFARSPEFITDALEAMTDGDMYIIKATRIFLSVCYTEYELMNLAEGISDILTDMNVPAVPLWLELENRSGPGLAREQIITENFYIEPAAGPLPGSRGPETTLK